jgi:hypothetical protein
VTLSLNRQRPRLILRCGDNKRRYADGVSRSQL